MGDAVGGGGDYSQAPPRGTVPQQALVPQPSMPLIAENQADQLRREQLAQLMQKYWIT